ncbi:MAG TPA: 2-oxoacid:acceptor oxidoreductase family protein [Thermodesulfovibrionales bacterium]|jgi:2-oxoglutarate ferredoxin oxidoreductase subunit gamma|nr:2-oxoacid:acceptor oxidoreductase family protein [Thermodesulfovibrionales bacterium]
MHELRIIAAGFGGQGILFFGRLIAYGGMIEGKEVTWFPSYGAEMLGGTANCTIVISDEMIGSPVVRNPDIFIAMNEASLRRFQPRIKPGGLLILDSSLIKSPELRPDVRAVSVPASELAASLSASRSSGIAAPQVKSANMVMLGALLASTGVMKLESALQALERLTSQRRKRSLEENRSAIMKGMHYLEDSEGKNI